MGRIRSGSVGPVPLDGVRRRLSPFVGLFVAVLTVAALVVRPDADPPVPPERGYLTDRAGMMDAARLAAHGSEPWLSGREALLAFADDALGREPRPAPVLDLDDTSGDFVDDTTDSYALALAWAVTGQERYASAAARIVNSWVSTARATRNTCPHTGACTTTLILGRAAPAFVFVADLLGETAFTGREIHRLREWLGELVLPAASERSNNWGDAGTFMRLVVSDYLGDEDEFDAALGAWRSALALTAADGHLPEEVRRGHDGIQYTQEALTYRVAVATLAERRGVDLWSERAPSGATLDDSVEYLAQFMADPTSWPWDDDPRRPAPGPMWELAFAHSHDCAYAPIIEEGRPFSERGNSAVRWTTLTNAAALDGCHT